jgi:molecular chaperone DnaK
MLERRDAAAVVNEDEMKNYYDKHKDDFKREESAKLKYVLFADVATMEDTVSTEKMMKEVDEKKVSVTEEEKNKVNDALKALKDVKDKDDVEAIKKAGDELSTAAQVIGTKMYQQGQQTPPGGSSEQPGATGGASDSGEQKKDGEGPIEGEVVDDKK